MGIKGKQAASTREVDGKKKTIEVWIRGPARIHWPSALSRISYRRIGIRTSISIQANRIQRGIHDAKAVFLGKKSVLIRGARLQIVNTFHIRNIRTNSHIRESSVLYQCLLLKAWGEIGEGITAGIIVELVMPHESAQR